MTSQSIYERLRLTDSTELLRAGPQVRDGKTKAENGETETASNVQCTSNRKGSCKNNAVAELASFDDLGEDFNQILTFQKKNYDAVF